MNEDISNKDLLVAASEVKVLVSCIYDKVNPDVKAVIFRHLKALNVMLETIYDDFKPNKP
jgi:hypothetical protein